VDYASFDQLVAEDRLPGEDVEIPGVGVVRVRALTRAEGLTLGSIKQPDVVERKTLHYGLVSPALSEAQVGEWQRKASFGELNKLTDKIMELSGLGEDSAKAAYKSDGGEPEPGV
jgi:hypothetical protein